MREPQTQKQQRGGAESDQRQSPPCKERIRRAEQTRQNAEVQRKRRQTEHRPAAVRRTAVKRMGGNRHCCVKQQRRRECEQRLHHRKRIQRRSDRLGKQTEAKCAEAVGKAAAEEFPEENAQSQQRRKPHLRESGVARDRAHIRAQQNRQEHTAAEDKQPQRSACGSGQLFLLHIFLLLRQQQQRRKPEQQRRELINKQGLPCRKRSQKNAEGTRCNKAADPRSACSSALQGFPSAADMEARVSKPDQETQHQRMGKQASCGDQHTAACSKCTAQGKPIRQITDGKLHGEGAPVIQHSAKRCRKTAHADARGSQQRGTGKVHKEMHRPEKKLRATVCTV